MGMLKQHIYELQQNRLTNPGAIKTEDHRIKCPRDVFIQLLNDFGSETWEANEKKRRRVVEKFTLIWAGQGDIKRPKNTAEHATCKGIQSTSTAR
jgi:hypothetical protein